MKLVLRVLVDRHFQQQDYSHSPNSVWLEGTVPSDDFADYHASLEKHRQLRHSVLLHPNFAEDFQAIPITDFCISTAITGIVILYGCGTKRLFIGGAASRVLEEGSSSSRNSRPGNNAAFFFLACALVPRVDFCCTERKQFTFAINI